MRREADDVMNGGLSVRWPDTWLARDMAFAGQAALVEKRRVAGSFQSGPPDLVILAVIGNRTGAGFEQGGVGTSVYRAFLLFDGCLPILKCHGTRAKNPEEYRQAAG